MASIASPSTHHFYPNKFRYSTSKSSFFPFIVSCMDQQPQQDENTKQVGRSGKKPNYLGVQKNPFGLALCPATDNCISTSENISDATHYAPPWNYNPEGKRGNISREKAMAELLQVVKSTKPDKSSPKIVEKTADYVRVEYESPILGLVDDVEFWFPPGKKTIVQYRAASRLGNYDFDANRKRIKALRMQLEKKGWASEDTV
ncbi:F-box/LRR-repeat protein [Capsicum annuum]|nr:F-box/LRR-repeat protein [Capsicum annuum]KAF3684931.1 F-box/LRR-repeat protein [Capsicum annuum]